MRSLKHLWPSENDTSCKPLWPCECLHFQLWVAVAGSFGNFGVIVCFPFLRFCKLRQSCLCAGCHSVNERLPDWHEAAESTAQALQERQQAILSTPPLRDWSEKDLLVSWRGAHLVIRSPKAVFLQSWKLIHAFYLAHLPLKTLLQPLLRIPLRMEDKFVLLFPVFYFGV